MYLYKNRIFKNEDNLIFAICLDYGKTRSNERAEEITRKKAKKLLKLKKCVRGDFRGNL